MKSLGLYLLNFTLLAMLVACGKDNESGKSTYNYNPYQSGYTGINGYGTINTSPYRYGNHSVSSVLQTNPCMGITGNHNRQVVQFPLTGFPTLIPQGDIYVGVTSLGDVAVVAGQANGQPPLFVGYVCQRQSYNQYGVSQQGQLVDLAIGSYSQCNFKPITRATMIIPGFMEPLYFRWLDAGNSQGQKFPGLCR